MKQNSSPTLLFLCVALFAGLWWWPVRTLAAMGLAGAWTGFAMALGALPATLVFVMSEKRGMTRGGILGAGFVGSAVTLYSTAFTEGEVVRVMMLFYLAPIWSLAIESVVWKRKITLRDGASVALVFAGILLICGTDTQVLTFGAPGDVMALSSGLLFSIGSALAFSQGKIGVFRFTLAAIVASLAVGSMVGMWSASALLPPVDMIGSGGLAILAVGTLFFLPVMAGTATGAFTIQPALLSVLLTAEIVSGVISSALFSGESLSLTELVGVCGIVSAIFLGAQKTPAVSAKS